MQMPSGSHLDDEIETVRSRAMSEEERDRMRKLSHECPVPKPRGRIGKVLGFKKEEVSEKPPKPEVETRPSKPLREAE